MSAGMAPPPPENARYLADFQGAISLAVSREKTENCAWSTPGSNAAKVVLLGEVLALRCPAVTSNVR